MTAPARAYIADDEAFNRDIAGRIVNKMGYAFECFDSVAALMERIREVPCDIALLDIHMPRQTGLEGLAKIRRTFDKIELPVLMITADDDTDTIVEAFALGANDYVTKPINAKVLRARIATQLQLSEASHRLRDYAQGAEQLVAQSAEDLRQKNADLAREVRLRMRAEETLRQQKDRAEEESRQKTDFMAVMTHELKTPLNISLGFAELIAGADSGVMGPKQCQEYAAIIAESNQSLLLIVEDLLIVSFSETGKLSLDEKEFPLVDAVRNACTRARPSPEQKRITVETDVSADIVVLADPSKLTRAILNLVSNAIKFSPEGSTCRVRAWINDNLQVSMAVEDEGVGIPKDRLDDVLKPFQQASTGLNRQFEGLGLGLPVSKLILDQHQANLQFTQRPGGGTCVSIALPPERTILASSARGFVSTVS